jgi:hypothetical protein
MDEVVLTARSKLLSRYGKEIISQLERVFDCASGSAGASYGERRLLFIDDEASVRRLGVAPVAGVEPQAVKRFLDRLDETLERRGELPPHYCILGGDEIIPFYRLPNPTFDGDSEIPSDSPYASRDDEFLVPERSLGRLPDPSPRGSYRRDSWRWLRIVERSLRPGPRGLPGSPDRAAALGCSAGAWKGASGAVFGIVGRSEELLVSPPLTVETFSPAWLAERRWLYFNLHGLPDGPGWYGEAAPGDPPGFPRFPLLIDPTLVERSDGAVVASEACYGADIIGRDGGSSIALAFLESGVSGFLGSTVTSYGPALPPPSEADLLVAGFLRHAAAGAPLGQALLRAKVEFAEQMLERQGFLDGDDRKTLLEFVLFADPMTAVA